MKHHQAAEAAVVELRQHPNVKSADVDELRARITELEET